jgi:hypothetical protein
VQRNHLAAPAVDGGAAIFALGSMSGAWERQVLNIYKLYD